MLKRYENLSCQCCSNPRPGRTYQWGNIRYCVTCLHSVGINAAGNYCTPRQYEDAWRELAR